MILLDEPFLYYAQENIFLCLVKYKHIIVSIKGKSCVWKTDPERFVNIIVLLNASSTGHMSKLGIIRNVVCLLHCLSIPAAYIIMKMPS